MPESFGLPLYEGVDWNSNANRYDNVTDTVSLFTREWIEIVFDSRRGRSAFGLPLYEGVDWNLQPLYVSLYGWGLPLYEGVDWNQSMTKMANWSKMSPSLRGSGLKSKMPESRNIPVLSLPLYEGVDWNMQ